MTVVQYSCPRCSRQFGSARVLGRHYQCSGHGPTPPKISTPRKRVSYTFKRKRDTLIELDSLSAGDGRVDFPALVLSRRTGISTSLLCKWMQNRLHIFTMASSPGIGKMRKYRQDGGLFPYCETAVYTKFLWRRRYLRLKTDRAWLRAKMQAIVDREHPGVVFVASQGWCSRFCKRWRISSQCRTNKHKASVLERLPQIRAFHQWLIYGLQRSGPQRCLKYGRFPPRRIYHLDQVPLPFSAGSKRTLNMIGEACEMMQPGGAGTTKRFCTLQVTICADPSKRPIRLEIYFRGQGKRLTDEEKDFYASLPNNITVRFQKKAWCDERIAMEFLEAFREQTIDQGEVLLGMDQHASQATPQCRTFMKLMDIVPAFTPANCTDCVSPVDHHVGQTLKLKIAKRYNDTYALNRDSWELPKKEGGLSDSKKRMLVAGWASEAWAEVCSDHQPLIRTAFVKTGFLLAKDGSENNLVELWKPRSREAQSLGPDEKIYNF